MNILVFGNGTLSVAQQERKICVEIAKKGHKVFLICNRPNILFNVGMIEKHENLKIFEIPMNDLKLEDFSTFSNEKMDVCLGMDQSVVPLVAEYKKRFHIPSYCMFLDFPVHVIDGKDPVNYNYQYSQRFYYWINCAMEIDSIIFNNTVAVEEFYKRYKRDSKLVWYAVMEDDYLYNLDCSVNIPTKDYVFGCNRVIPYKGTDIALQSMKRLPYEYKHAFVSADSKEISKLKSIAKEFPYNVKFFEKLSENEKMNMFWNAKLIVYPQIIEWIGGMSILEGMSVKTPGICFDYPVLRELYDDCVIYAKPKNFMDLREKIKQLYEDEYLNKELAVKGYERFKRYFTREVMAYKLIEVLNGII